MKLAAFRVMKKTLLLTSFLLLTIAATPGVRRSSAFRIGPVMPEIVSFTANPKVIAHGETVTLAWEMRGVPSVSIAWGPEYHQRGTMQRKTELPPSGTMIVRPMENTLYVLECGTLAGDVCMAASASVRVK